MGKRFIPTEEWLQTIEAEFRANVPMSVLEKRHRRDEKTLRMHLQARIGVETYKAIVKVRQREIAARNRKRFDPSTVNIQELAKRWEGGEPQWKLQKEYRIPDNKQLSAMLENHFGFARYREIVLAKITKPKPTIQESYDCWHPIYTKAWEPGALNVACD